MACNAIKMIMKSFWPLIASTVNSPHINGIDIAKEERLVSTFVHEISKMESRTSYLQCRSEILVCKCVCMCLQKILRLCGEQIIPFFCNP